LHGYRRSGWYFLLIDRQNDKAIRFGHRTQYTCALVVGTSYDVLAVSAARQDAALKLEPPGFLA
jgi:hypothetical protein